MNVISTLKKIFNSYDFRGNRIKNLRVDTPDESIEYRENDKDNPEPDSGYFGKLGETGPGGVQHFVANKKYVDQKTTLNTDKTWRFKNENKPPFFIWWLKDKDIYGKPYKEIFDELFFPQIPYQFISPEVTDINIFAINRPLIDTIEIDNNFKKFVIYNNCDNKFRIKIKQNRNDWSSSLTGQIIIKYYDNTEISFNSIDTNNIESVFEIEFLWYNIKQILFKRIFDNHELRVDTYGNNSEPKEPIYTLEYDITENFKKYCYPFTLQIYDNELSDWKYVDNIFISAESPKIINLFLNPTLFTKQYCLKAYIYNDSGEFINWILIGHKDFNQTNDGMKIYDFGYYPFNVNIQIVPQAIKLV